MNFLAQITQDTSLTLPLSIVAIAIMALCGAVVRANNTFHKINTNIQAIRDDLHYKVERREFDKWAVDLERGNRDVVRQEEGKSAKRDGLIVPELPPLPRPQHAGQES